MVCVCLRKKWGTWGMKQHYQLYWEPVRGPKLARTRKIMQKKCHFGNGRLWWRNYPKKRLWGNYQINGFIIQGTSYVALLTKCISFWLRPLVEFKCLTDTYWLLSEKHIPIWFGKLFVLIRSKVFIREEHIPDSFHYDKVFLLIRNCIAWIR